MLIDAPEKSVTYRYPDGEIVINPGKPIEVEYWRALKLLKKAGSRVRVVKLSHADWLTAWRELADVTVGIEPGDPRLRPVLAALDRADECYLARNWTGFQEAAMRVHASVQSVR